MTIEVYIHDTDKLWGHAAININGTVYNQSGTGGISGEAPFYRVNYETYCKYLVDHNQGVTRYKITGLSAEDEKKAVDYLNKRFNEGTQILEMSDKGSALVSPNKVEQHFDARSENCTIITSEALVKAGVLQEKPWRPGLLKDALDELISPKQKSKLSSSKLKFQVERSNQLPNCSPKPAIVKPQGRLKDKASAPHDNKVCDKCPHPVAGPAVQGSPNVFVNKRPALRVNSKGQHNASDSHNGTPNTWVAKTGSTSVFINGQPAHRMTDATEHIGGGTGQLMEGSPNVLVG